MMNFQHSEQRNTTHQHHSQDCEAWLDETLYDALIGPGNDDLTSGMSMMPTPQKVSGLKNETSNTMPISLIPTQNSSNAISQIGRWLDCHDNNGHKMSNHGQAPSNALPPKMSKSQGSEPSTFTVTIPIDCGLKAMVEAGIYVVQFRFVPADSKHKTPSSVPMPVQDTRSESNGSTSSTGDDALSSHASTTPGLPTSTVSGIEPEKSATFNSRSGRTDSISSWTEESHTETKVVPASQTQSIGSNAYLDSSRETSVPTKVNTDSEANDTTSSTRPMGPKGSSVPIQGIDRGGYIDYSKVPEEKQGLPISERNTGGVTRPFPERLFHMLSDDKYSDIISWAPHGRAFHIKDQKAFEHQVLTKYFNQTKYRSFQRQLNLYGFKRIHQDFDRGAYYHELFLRGRPNLCSRMKRQKLKGKGKEQKGSYGYGSMEQDMAPNFYTMDSL